MFAYLPRALQIGLLAPFPNFWFETGYTAAGTAMRFESGIEMVFAYFCLLGLPLFIWRNPGDTALWLVIFVCISLLAIYAITVPNLGALYRFRFPYFMTMVGLGLAGWTSRKGQAPAPTA